MSFTLHGIAVSSGIAIGYAHLISHTSLEVVHYVLPKQFLDEEIARFDTALQSARREFASLRSNRPSHSAAEFDAFIELHQMILDDPLLSIAPREMIVAEHCNAEWALKIQTEALVAQFDEFEDAYLRERQLDVKQVAERLLMHLSGHPSHLPQPARHDVDTILVADDLSPADLIQFKPQQYAAFITDVGGATSHTAIVARSLNTPCVVGLHHARMLLREDDLLILDGEQGVLIVNPDKAMLAEYKLRQSEWELERKKLKRLRTARANTLDGAIIELHANIERPEDIVEAKEHGATGIGLFRSEFLFLNRHNLPSEEEQFTAYRAVAEGMEGQPVTIRTFDLGSDKPLKGKERTANNPALGLRAIRLCLAEPALFRTQLRALLRATHYGNIKILIPMLSCVSELNQTLQFIAATKQSLDHEGIPYNREVKIGGMIEIPAAALSLNIFAEKLDFLSIGTNDLIQYTLAIDRTDQDVAHLYDPLHPAILYLLAHIIGTSNKLRKPISLCGEMAGELPYTRLLLGMGLRQFSMSSVQVPSIKQRVLTTSLPDIAPLTHKILRTDDPMRLRELLDKLNTI
ncbi:MAG: phosphoenolpyruvate--protein phosphotransferase [Gallionella sp.]|nr:phosphoenolpyruvate--protein phosphotransferase [Gallionella sp.]